jgi:coproporphyrinogen III oxidase
MPALATAHRPELAGRSFESCGGVPLVIHPNSPGIFRRPCQYAFLLLVKALDPGGLRGFDERPIIPVSRKTLSWHQTAAGSF